MLKCNIFYFNIFNFKINFLVSNCENVNVKPSLNWNHKCVCYFIDLFDCEDVMFQFNSIVFIIIIKWKIKIIIIIIKMKIKLELFFLC